MRYLFSEHGGDIAKVVALVALVSLIGFFLLHDAPINSSVTPSTDSLINSTGSSSDATAQETTAPTTDTNADPFIALPLSTTAATMQNGDLLQIEENCIKKNKTLSFTGTINSMGSLIFRHGNEVYGSSYVTIDNNKLEVYSYYDAHYLLASHEHGLSLTGEVNITLAANNAGQIKVTIVTDEASYSSNYIEWEGSHGMIEMEAIDTVLSNVTLTWDCSDYQKDIWMFGDSYMGVRGSSRWPTHLISAGYDTALISGFSGAVSNQMYPDWQTALTHGTPKYAVWCLGMNDPDSESGINQSWKTHVNTFVADCEEKGITPILVTIPNTPTRNHTFKNEYIKTLGYRYIDFAAAVGATEANSTWYDSMLSSDNVHPSDSGAQALANQVLLDFPEIKQ